MNLEPEIYAIARSLAKAEDCSLSAAVNRLLRRALSPRLPQPARRAGNPSKRNGFHVSRGRQPITADIVRNTDAHDDAQ